MVTNASSVDRVVEGMHRIARTFEHNANQIYCIPYNPRVKTKAGTRAFPLAAPTV